MRFPRFLAILAFALSATLAAQDLTSVKVDNMSDDEIRAVLNAGAAKGIDINEGEKIALGMGLAPAEAAKFKARVDQLNGKSKPAGQGAATDGTLSPDATLGNTVAVETAVMEQAEVKSEAAVAVAGLSEGTETPGEKLPVQVYGQQYFRGVDMKIYERSLDARASDAYIIGVGDEIGVSAYGTAYFSEVYKVDERGIISMRNVGNIYARGLTYGDLKQVLKGKLSNFLPLSSNTVAFTLAYSRTISVNVVGEVLKPGTYKIPAVNTAFNALMAAGGPSNLGTLREIKIIRDGKVVRTLDIYAFLANPTAANDYFMQDNDYLSVGIIGNVVSVDGAVKRPMRYEVKKGETLNDLLMYAGGFTEIANTSFVQVKRLTGDESQLFEVADLKQVIQPGDDVNVLARNTELRKAVSIAGAVNLPGTYRFQEGMTLRQLIEKAGGLRNDSIVAIDRAWLVRTKPDYTMDYVEIDLFAVMADANHPDNVSLNAKDELTITTKKDFTEEEYVSLGGSVRNPVRTKYARGIRVSTLLKMADGVKFETYTGQATLRRTKADLSQEFLNLDLQAILDQPNGPADLVLEPRDAVTVLQKPDFDASLAVSITGAVRAPVTTPFAEGMTLGDVLRLAGGLKPNADYQRVEVSRLNAFSEFQKGTNREVRTIALLTEVPAELVRDLSATSPALDFKLQPYDQIVVREIPEYKMQEFVYIGGEVQYPGYYPIMKRDEKLSSLIGRAGGPTRYADIKNATLNRTGAPNVVVNLRKAIVKRRSPFNYTLLPGDALEIPRTDYLVSIVGTGHKYYENASKFEVNVPFTSKRSARRYVKEYALGFAKKADRAGLYVDYPNGNVDRTKNFGLFKDYPTVKKGGTIHIAMKPEKVKDEKEERERKPFDMNQAVATVAASITSFATLFILLTR